MNVKHPMSVLLSFSIRSIFYDKMNFRLFFHVTLCIWEVVFETVPNIYDEAFGKQEKAKSR